MHTSNFHKVTKITISSILRHKCINSWKWMLFRNSTHSSTSLFWSMHFCLRETEHWKSLNPHHNQQCENQQVYPFCAIFKYYNFQTNGIAGQLWRPKSLIFWKKHQDGKRRKVKTISKQRLWFCFNLS